MHDANHPVWAILRTVVLLAALVIVLWLNATDFDATEIKTIVAMFLTAIGAETATKYFSKRGGDGNQ